MKLYHGTSETVARLAINAGLKPRKVSGNSNYQHTAESHPDMIYLTLAYAPYYGIQAAGVKDELKFGILEINADKLDSKKFLPDEDFIWHNVSQHPATKKKCKSWGKDMAAQVSYIRDHLHDYAEWWPECLKHMGNVCYQGSIPTSAITKAVIVETIKAPEMCNEAMQPTISPTNYLHFGKTYSMIQGWFMGEDIDTDEFAVKRIMGGMSNGFKIPPEMEEMIDKGKVAWRKIADNRTAIEIIKAS